MAHKGILTELRLVAGASDVGIQSLSLAQIIDAVKPFDGIECAAQLAAFNCGLENGGLDVGDYQVFLANMLFPRHVLEALAEMSVRRQFVLSFTPKQLLCIIKLMLAHGKGDMQLLAPEAKEPLAMALLSLNDRIAEVAGSMGEPQYEKDPELSLLYLQVLMTQSTHTDPRYRLGSTNANHYIIERLLQRETIAVALASHFSLPPVAYVKAVLCLSAFFTNVLPQYIRNQGAAAIDMRFLFLSVGLTKEAFDEVFRLHVLEPEQHLDKTRLDDIAHLTSLGDIIKRPFVALPNHRLVCISPSIAVQLLSRSLRTMIANCIPCERRNQEVFVPAGEALGDFAVDLLKQMEARHAHLGASAIGSIRSPNGALELDAGYAEGSHIALVECKSGPCPVDVEFGGDISKIKKHLEGKFIERGGFSQLVSKTQRYLDGHYGSLVPKADVIWPVLVVEDELASGHFGSKFCERRTQHMFEALGPKVRRPLVLHVDELHMLTARLTKRSLFDVLHAIESRATVSTRNAIQDCLNDDPDGEPVDLGKALVDQAYEEVTGALLGPSLEVRELCPACSRPLERIFTQDRRTALVCTTCPGAGPSHEPDQVSTQLWTDREAQIEAWLSVRSFPSTRAVR